MNAVQREREACANLREERKYLCSDCGASAKAGLTKRD